jgi:copper transport protein
MLLICAAACAALLALAPAAALAHAQLQGTSPAAETVVRIEPRAFVFHFDETVQGGVGSVRVFDAQGHRVDDGTISHPGTSRSIAVGLRPGLPDGTYLATYRVVSVDTHVVSGGATFSIGHPGGQGSLTVAGLLARDRTGRATLLAFGVVRALGYLAIALFAGGLAFLSLLWRGAEAIGEADERLRGRARAILAAAAALGLIVTALAFGLQGSEEGGVSFSGAFGSGVLEGVIHSRFGTWWGLRLLDWAALLALCAAGARIRFSRAWEALCGLGGVLLIVTVVLSGHAYSQSPRGLLIASDFAHLTAMSLWLGGLAMMLVALPRATAALDPPERSRLLSGLLGAFSPLALASVVVLAGTGALQAYIHVRTFHGLLHTGYGHDVLAKTVLLAVLVGLGYGQRGRVMPALREAVKHGSSPGAAGFRLRNLLRLEVLAIVAVIGVTGALVDYTPPVSQEAGPVNVSARIGPTELEMTVEPARAGPNGIHIYLLNARSGLPYTAAKEVRLTAALPARSIGAQKLALQPAGPGHWVVSGAQLIPAGAWRLGMTVRVSEFQQFTRQVEVSIR